VAFLAVEVALGVKRRKGSLTAAEKRAVASAGLIVSRYQPDGERAEGRQLAPEVSGAKRPSLFLRPGSSRCLTTDKAPTEMSE
jgi:hypothetical protein